ncbi:GIY-YIG nuclease family protein [Virgibacillus sp. FSP13]
MLKIDTGNNIFFIEKSDIELGIREIRKSSGIPVQLNGIYRLYDKNGTLLYVGMSSKILNRVFDHMRGKSLNTNYFYQEIEWAEILTLPNNRKSTTEKLEQFLIKTLNPKHNELKWSDYTIINWVNFYFGI